jgi:hypothetical protein
MKQRFGFFLMIIVLSAIALSPARAEEPNTGKIDLRITTEENKKIILATATADGKPLANATVNFYVKRTFGNLGIGHDVTLDDGTAAVPFPVDLPGGTTGRLEVIAVISSPPQYNTFHGETTFDGALITPVQTEVFPRALWAPQAPLALILTIAGLITVVWGTYIYIAGELIKICREGIK